MYFPEGPDFSACLVFGIEAGQVVTAEDHWLQNKNIGVRLAEKRYKGIPNKSYKGILLSVT